MFNIRELPTNLTYTCPWYFNDIVINLRTFLHVRHFPNITSSDMYSAMLTECKPKVTEKYNMNWDKIWKQITFKYINLYERDVMFKFIHNILPNKLRLFQMKQNNSPLCVICDIIEDTNHMFISCRKVINLLNYFKAILNDACNITNLNMENILFLDIKAKTKKELNTATVLTVNYISTVWYNRSRNEHLKPLLIKTNVLKHQMLLSLILKDQMPKIFTEKYCMLDYFT